MNIGNVSKIAHATNVASQMTGGLNPTTRKVNSSISFVKTLVVGIILFILGLFFVIAIFPIGLIFLAFSVLFFFMAFYSKNRTNRFLKMQKELINNLPREDEFVSVFFSDIGSLGEVENNQVEIEKENVMILTNKRIIFLYVPRMGLEGFTEGNVLKNIKRSVSFHGLKKKVEDELKVHGLLNLIKDSRIKYSMNYEEITRVKANKFLSKVVFFYRGKKFKYNIRRDEFLNFEKIFKNYIK